MFLNRSERESSQALIMDRNSAPTRRVDDEYLEPRSTVRMKSDWNLPPGGPPVQSPDSGVVMDNVDGIQFDDLTASWKKPQYRNPPPYPTNSQPKYRPESVAVEGHEYEQLPGFKRQPTLYADIPEDLPSTKLPTPPNSRATSVADIDPNMRSDTSDPNMRSGTSSEQRRRENPLYDSMPEYKSMGSIRSDFPPSKSSPCLCVAVVMSTVLALGALVLAIVVIILLKNSSSGAGPSAGGSSGSDLMIQQLQRRVSLLEKQLANATASSSMPDTIASEVEQNTAALEVIVHNITLQQRSIEDLKRNVNESGLNMNAMTVSVSNLTSAITSVTSDLNETKLNLKNKSDEMERLQDTIAMHNAKIALNSRKGTDLELTIKETIHNQTLIQTQVVSSQELFSGHALYVNRSLSSLHLSLLDTKSSLVLLNSSFDYRLAVFNSSIYDELSTISKMPGPAGPRGLPGPEGIQGPSGAGNLSLCKRLFGSAATSSSSTATGYVPVEQGWKVLGVECSVSPGGSSSFAEYSTTSSEYRCKCKGKEGSTWRCIIYVWVCPVLS